MSGYVPLRGRVLLEKDRYEAGEDGLSPGGIILPATHYDARDNDGPQVHRGRVVAMGPPARTRKGHEVAPGFRVGDTVLFIYALATEDFRTVRFPQIHDGIMVVVAQEEVQAVIGRAFACHNCRQPIHNPDGNYWTHDRILADPLYRVCGSCPLPVSPGPKRDEDRIGYYRDHGTTEYRAAVGERSPYDPMADPEEPACP